MHFSLRIHFYRTVGARRNTTHTQSTPPPAALADLTALRTRLAQPNQPLIWVITGDSITQGARWVGREHSYPELIQNRVLCLHP